MSYSIFYRSMFVKLSNNKYIPMMEMGDNNVYEASYGRGKAKRVRSWSNANLNRGQKFFTHDEIVSSLNSWYNESEQKRNRDKESGIDWKIEAAKSQSFGYYEAVAVDGKHTTDTTFNHVKNLVLRGEKNCISFEEAVKVCGLNIYYWEDSKDGGFPRQKHISFETEEEMFSRIPFTLVRMQGIVHLIHSGPELGNAKAESLLAELARIPDKITRVLEEKERLQWFSSKMANTRDIFFIGRGLDYAISLEGSLKMKEISYIHSESYAAGELKHGTISLVEKGILVIGVLTQGELLEKTLSNMEECKARGAYLMGVTMNGDYFVEDAVNFTIYVPRTDPHFAGSLAVIPLQLLGYYTCVARGLDVDKPRNLAKSVTVE